jgi:L-fuconolactonase
MMRIDTHQHFWTFKPEHYTWIGADMAALRRDFGPADLEPQLRAAGIDATLLVEARGHLEETENLLRIAEQTSFVRGVVGWVPLTAPDIDEVLAKYAMNPKLRAVRHWLGGDTDRDYMFQADLQRGMSRLLAFDLTYDLMLWPPQLGAVSVFVDRHPHQRFVLDHFAKPYIRAGELELWRRELKELARRPNVYCKVSGLATEASHESWTLEDLRPYLDAALDAFSPRRLMFGSDWPVCTLATSYVRWAETIAAWIRPLETSEQGAIMGGTAADAYQL